MADLSPEEPPDLASPSFGDTAGVEPAIPPSFDGFAPHRTKVVAACRFAADQPDVVGMVLTGSFAQGNVDMFSDVDLRVIVEDEALDRVLARREEFPRAAGSVVAHFPGDHVGEPNLSIVLYDDLTHVDYFFLPLAGAGKYPGPAGSVILWERDGRVSAVPAEDPPPEGVPSTRLAWIEARMWTWSWYIQTKIVRGELYEAIDGLNYVREHVLLVLLALEQGTAAAGFRRLEGRIGDRAPAFAATIAGPDPGALLTALRAAMHLYVELSRPLLARHGVIPNDPARRVVLAALDAGLDWRPSPPPGV